MKVGELLDFRRQYCGFGDCCRLLLVVAWPRLRKPPPSLVVMCSRAISRSPMGRLAKRAVPPFSEAEQRRIRVLPQFSTIICASAWP